MNTGPVLVLELTGPVSSAAHTGFTRECIARGNAFSGKSLFTIRNPLRNGYLFKSNGFPIET